jgi:hypothetical protein
VVLFIYRELLFPGRKVYFNRLGNVIHESRAPGRDGGTCPFSSSDVQTPVAASTAQAFRLYPGRLVVVIDRKSTLRPSDTCHWRMTPLKETRINSSDTL